MAGRRAQCSFAKAQTEQTSPKVGWLPFDQCCGKQSEVFKPEQITNWREGTQCWGLGFGFGFLFPAAFGPCISCCLTSAAASCVESHCFLAGKANRSSEMRQNWDLQAKSLACCFCWATSNEASRARAPALRASGSEIPQQSRSPRVSTTALSQALPMLLRALHSPQRAQLRPWLLWRHKRGGERKMPDPEHPFWAEQARWASLLLTSDGQEQLPGWCLRGRVLLGRWASPTPQALPGYFLGHKELRVPGLTRGRHC